MDLFAPKHLLLVLAIVLLVFGGKKIKSLGSDLGSAFRGFKRSMSEGENESPSPAPDGPAIRGAVGTDNAIHPTEGTSLI